MRACVRVRDVDTHLKLLLRLLAGEEAEGADTECASELFMGAVSETTITT